MRSSPTAFLRMHNLPKKLKKDAITEAICEVRFASEDLPEVVIGRVADNPDWRRFSKLRLPISDIPSPVRSQDPSLKYQPIVELRDTKQARIIKVGTNVLSYHVLAPYCGWTTFEGELSNLFKFLFERLEDLRCSRLGFRYVNTLNARDHYIGDISALNQKVIIAGEILVPPLNLNYMKKYSEHQTVMVRIGSPEFIIGQLPVETGAVIDIDVFTPDPFEVRELGFVTTWLSGAHDIEKSEFFRLIPDHVLDKLKES